MKEQGNSLQQVEVGQDVTLICNYQMMGDSLYSIKWYRDDKEFYRYIPNGKNYRGIVEFKRYILKTLL